MLIAGKILQALGIAYLGVTYILILPATPRGRDLAIAAVIFSVGWLLVKSSRAR